MWNHGSLTNDMTGKTSTKDFHSCLMPRVLTMYNVEGGSNPWFSTKYITTWLLLLLVLKDFTKYNFRVLWSTQTYSKYWGFYDFSVCWGGGGGSVEQKAEPQPRKDVLSSFPTSTRPVTEMQPQPLTEPPAGRSPTLSDVFLTPPLIPDPNPGPGLPTGVPWWFLYFRFFSFAHLW